MYCLDNIITIPIYGNRLSLFKNNFCITLLILPSFLLCMSMWVCLFLQVCVSCTRSKERSVWREWWIRRDCESHITLMTALLYILRGGETIPKPCVCMSVCSGLGWNQNRKSKWKNLRVKIQRELYRRKAVVRGTHPFTNVHLFIY